MNLSLNYDAWRLAGPPEPDPLHPGPHASALLIEAGEIAIDAVGHYDGDGGALVSVQINGRHYKPETVADALAMLGVADSGFWSGPLDDDKLIALSDEAFEAMAEARAEFNRRDDE